MTERNPLTENGVENPLAGARREHRYGTTLGGTTLGGTTLGGTTQDGDCVQIREDPHGGDVRVFKCLTVPEGGGRSSGSGNPVHGRKRVAFGSSFDR